MEKKHQGESCCITATASGAVRIARIALEMGESLEGTKFILGGEAYTETKREVIERVGAVGASRYAFGGGINVGFGCANPLHIDDVHINQHLIALLPHPYPLAGDSRSIHPLLCTTLYDVAPRFQINVGNGDYATLEERDCGCELGKDKQYLKGHLKGLFVLSFGLREFFRERFTVAQSREEIIRSLENREERFLELVRTKVYERPDSSYLKLFKIAGCDFGESRPKHLCGCYNKIGAEIMV